MEQQKEFILTTNDFNKEKLELSWVSEKIKLQSDLASLHEQIVTWELEKNIDLSKVKSYFESIKDKNWEELKNEWASLSFAVQIFLKNQNMYTGKIDGLYMTKWKLDSKTRQAVKLFQSKNWLNPDGWTGHETIQKMLNFFDKTSSSTEEIISVPVSHFEISSEFHKLSSIQQKLFWEWKYLIKTDKTIYFFKDNHMQKTELSNADYLEKRINSKKD